MKSYQITLVVNADEASVRELTQRVLGIFYVNERARVEAWRLDEMVPGKGPLMLAADVESKEGR